MVTGAVMAQVTTSSIDGKVVAGGVDVIGATVTAVHQPSGTRYNAVTNIDGRYTIPGMRVGGPYKITISYIGYQDKVFNGVNLNLGETEDFSCNLTEDAQVLGEVVVTGESGLNATKTGAAQSFSAAKISELPSVTHSISDIARLNPQVSTNDQSGSISFAGTNNRYNSFQIDGVMNNDAFGLTSNGSNGGQAGTQPVSMETIDQIQINVAPFDVRQSGFTGGAINAITKSGTNQFHGSAYFDGNNQSLVGKHFKNPDGTYANPIDDEKEYRYGFTLGGPIVKDKLFFFANYEKSNKTYPNNYGFGVADSKVDVNRANEILDAVKDIAKRQGVDYNTEYSSEGKSVKSQKGGVKLDWNINDFNKLSLRWSIVDASQTLGLGGIATLNTSDHLYTFKSRTNSFALELQSRLSPALSNEARASYVSVRDKRTSGAAAPSVTIYKISPDGQGTINIGNEYSSMANSLDQDIFTVEDNLTWFKGNHTFTFGTHNEFYKFSNLYLPNLFGCYYFKDYETFMNYYGTVQNGQPDGTMIRNYYYSHANTAITGDPLWKSELGAGQLGFYVQDKWNATRNFTLTYGLRMELPLFFDTPTANNDFNDFAASMGWDYRTDRKIKSTPMWSPRVGFRWDVNGDRKYILRGGAGVFTGRIPFVWLVNNIANTGIQTSSYNASKGLAGMQLYMDANGQEGNAKIVGESAGSQTINVAEENFKFAQNLRLNLGFDFNALGIDWTAEAIYSKTLNDVYYENLAYEENGNTFGQLYGYEWDNRPMMERVSNYNAQGKKFGNIYALRNTSGGYSYNLSLKAEKHFNFGLDLAASYTYTQSKSISSVTSSVAQSNWRNNHTYRHVNSPELGNSAFNIPHVVKASAFYHFNWGPSKLFQTTVGIIYEGKSGSPYDLTYSGTDMNGDGYAGNELFFIPTDEQIDRMKFQATADFPADVQRSNLKAWLASQDYIKDHRGEYYERYADNLPFEHHFDLHIGQKFGIKTGSYIHNLEVTFDVMNVGNMLNKDWGLSYGSGYNSEYIIPLSYMGNGEFQFADKADKVLKYPSDYYSRWRGQIGVKYTF